MKSAFQRIAVALDFSDESDRAFAHARALARRDGATLALLHAAEGIRPGGEDDREMWFELEDATRRAVEDRAAEVPAELRTSTHVLEGDTDAAIAEAVTELDIDLLVVGTHGRTGLRRFLLGSTAEKLTRHAPCSVLVARGPAPVDGRHERILVPTDFTERAGAALEAALDLAAPGAGVDLLHCWQAVSPFGAVDVAATVVASAREEQLRTIAASRAALLDRYADRDVELGFEVRERPTAHGIQEALEDGDYSLVAMGSHERTGLSRWLLGSVAETTVRHAPCSVLVVKR